MKIRSGFVSNSSSSSFILFGIKVEDKEYKDLCESFLPKECIDKYIEKYYKDEDKEDIEWCDLWYDNQDETELDVIRCGYGGETWIGKTLADGDDKLEMGDLSFEEMNKMAEEIKKKLPDGECKLYYGTYGC